MSTSIILALDLSSPKRRGLCIGLINCGLTTGVATGAVLAGLLTPTLGWVCPTQLIQLIHQLFKF
jgi:predicted MFS family arabinose efflux permease